MSGGKGGSKSSSVEIPEFVRAPAERNLQRAEQAAMLGPMIYGGPDVAAFTQPQVAGMQATADAAAAMGLAPQTNVAAGLPQARDYGGGIFGYSGMSLYDQALADLQARAPGQVQQLAGMFMDPATGELPQNYLEAIRREEEERAARNLVAAGPASGRDYGSGDANPAGTGGSGNFNQGGGYQGGGWSDPQTRMA